MAPKNFFLPAFLWTLCIAVACFVSANSIPKVSLLGKDKLIHALFYFVFTLLWFLYLKKKFPSKSFSQKAGGVLLMTFFYGSLIEILQGALTTTRNADFFDIMANVTGCLFALLVLKFFELKKNQTK